MLKNMENPFFKEMFRENIEAYNAARSAGDTTTTSRVQSEIPIRYSTTWKQPIPDTSTSKQPITDTTTSKLLIPDTTSSTLPSTDTTTSKQPITDTTTSKLLIPDTTSSTLPITDTTTAKVPIPDTTTSMLPNLPIEATTMNEPVEGTTALELPTEIDGYSSRPTVGSFAAVLTGTIQGNRFNFGG